MTIEANVQQVLANIHAACDRAGRDPAEVTLLAVSKKHSVESVVEAAQVGVQHFGENRVEEAIEKIPAVNSQLTSPVIWHMVGHIQSRKAREIPPLFQVVHSVDRLKIASKLSQLVVEHKQSLDIFIEMNVSGESSKSGFAAANWANDSGARDALWQVVSEISRLPGLNLRGLMTMAPIVSDMEMTRPVFAQLAALRQALAESLELTLPDLSMGMTDDYPVAVEEGATIVRVGRAIFGPREE